MLFGKAAENEHRQVGRAGLDAGEGIDAALVGHGDVEHDHVDLPASHDVEGLTAVVRFGHDRKVRLIGKELLQAGTNHGMVINDGNSNHGVPLLLLNEDCMLSDEKKT